MPTDNDTPAVATSDTNSAVTAPGPPDTFDAVADFDDPARARDARAALEKENMPCYLVEGSWKQTLFVRTDVAAQAQALLGIAVEVPRDPESQEGPLPTAEDPALTTPLTWKRIAWAVLVGIGLVLTCISMAKMTYRIYTSSVNEDDIIYRKVEGRPPNAAKPAPR